MTGSVRFVMKRMLFFDPCLFFQFSLEILLFFMKSPFRNLRYTLFNDKDKEQKQKI